MMMILIKKQLRMVNAALESITIAETVWKNRYHFIHVLIIKPLLIPIIFEYFDEIIHSQQSVYLQIRCIRFYGFHQLALHSVYKGS